MTERNCPTCGCPVRFGAETEPTFYVCLHDIEFKALKAQVDEIHGVLLACIAQNSTAPLREWTERGGGRE